MRYFKITFLPVGLVCLLTLACGVLDSDGDGIPDKSDLCPRYKEDYDGFEDADGCPDRDNDKDGIPDSEDKCPDESEDFDGYKDADGCPDNDNDKDGVPDTKDRCPNEAETINGYQDEDGCPDSCPDYEGPRLIRLEGINFKANSADIKTGTITFCPECRQINDGTNSFCNWCGARLHSPNAILADAAQILKDNPSITVTIIGHTSDRGERAFLMQLSYERALAVMNALVNNYGISRNRLTAVGMGPDDPIASNATAEGRARNSRIEFRVD